MQLTFYITNFEACIFFYIARQGGFSSSTWVSALGEDWFSDDSMAQKYI
jgi:hypothetical protein